MKLLYTSAGLFLFLITATCNNQTLDDTTIEVTGNIEAIEISSWQYGTHTIRNEDFFYALTSENIDLQEYEGQSVTIKAKKIEGYPVDGGPEYLKVEEIKK